MKTVRGTIAGPLFVDSDLDIQGTVAGDVVVREARTLHLRGAITGSLTIEEGATAVIYGTIGGRVRKLGGTLVITHPDSNRREAPSNRAPSSTNNV
jgi:hypothetical protein